MPVPAMQTSTVVWFVCESHFHSPLWLSPSPSSEKHTPCVVVLPPWVREVERKKKEKNFCIAQTLICNFSSSLALSVVHNKILRIHLSLTYHQPPLPFPGKWRSSHETFEPLSESGDEVWGMEDLFILRISYLSMVQSIAVNVSSSEFTFPIILTIIFRFLYRTVTC